MKYYNKIINRIKNFPIGGTRGQVLGIFALMGVVFYLSFIVMLNLGWYINMRMRVQNACDSAAIADTNSKVSLLNAEVVINWVRYAGDIGAIIAAIFGGPDAAKGVLKAMSGVQQAFGFLDIPVSIYIGQRIYYASVAREKDPKDPMSVCSSFTHHLMGINSWLKICSLGEQGQEYDMSCSEKHPDSDEEPCNWVDYDKNDEILKSYDGMYDAGGPKSIYMTITLAKKAPFAGDLFDLKTGYSLIWSKAVCYGGNLHHIGSYAAEKWTLVTRKMGEALDKIHAPAGAFFDGSKTVYCSLKEAGEAQIGQ